MKSIMITGASGFIGSELVKQSLASGFDVLATARSAASGLSEHLGTAVKQLDVLDQEATSGTYKADFLVHCATANDQVSADFEKGVSLSAVGTRNVLDLAHRNKIRNVVFLSTLQVYGTELSGVIDESTPTNCETPYALNHKFGEEVCELYAKRYGLNVVLLRPSNVFGVPAAPTVNRSTLVPMCFIREAFVKGAVTLRSSGLQSRNFVSTTDVAKQILNLIDGFPAGCTPVNCGSNWYATISSIADLTADIFFEELGRGLKIERQSSLPDTSNQFHVSSIYRSSWPKEQLTQSQMSETIRKLIALYSTSNGE